MRITISVITVRRMMSVVALVAVVLGVWIQWRRSGYCMDRAASHGSWEARRRAEGMMMLQHDQVIAGNLAIAVADEHARLRSMYQHAAFRPWEALPHEPVPN